MKTATNDTELARCARMTAARYRSLAHELAGAADTLDKPADAKADLPIVSIESFGAAIKAGMILHYLADGL